MSISADSLHAREDVLATGTRTSLRKTNEKKTANNRYLIHTKRIIYEHFTAHELAAHFAGKKVLHRFLPSLLHANDCFLSCRHDLRPYRSPGDANPRRCCQALAAILSRWLLTIGSFELPQLWCNANRCWLKRTRVVCKFLLCEKKVLYTHW